MRIALLAVLAFAGLWLVALRPKPGGPAAPPVPAAQNKPAKPAQKPSAKGVTGAAAKAETAVAKANASTAKRETTAAKTSEGKAAPAAAKPAVAAAKPAPAAAPAAAKPATAAAKPAAAAAKPAAPAATADTPVKVERVLADIEKGKVVVLLFWNKKLDDDREVYKAAAHVKRHDGKVSVRAASIDTLGDYERITRGVPVVTTPTVLVIDRDRRARSVAGLTVTSELNQLADRALKGK